MILEPMKISGASEIKSSRNGLILREDEPNFRQPSKTIYDSSKGLLKFFRPIDKDRTAKLTTHVFIVEGKL